MARKKEYIEEEVIEKAMRLFWRNGYNNTSMQMLEKSMGINKFSIYSSFSNKHGVFIECLKSYKKKTNDIFEKLKNSTKGAESIKDFFHDSLGKCNQRGNEKGCLITNTYYEFSKTKNESINMEMEAFMDNLKNIFIKKLSKDTTKDKATILKQANFLLLAKHGLSTASKVNSPKEIEDYIELTFKNI